MLPEMLPGGCVSAGESWISVRTKSAQEMWYRQRRMQGNIVQGTLSQAPLPGKPRFLSFQCSWVCTISRAQFPHQLSKNNNLDQAGLL